MTITIEIPEGITEQQAAEITTYVNGLITFYLDEARQVKEKESTALDIERLAVLKADEVKLAQVDEAIATAKVAEMEPMKVVEDVMAGKVEVAR